jgi:hypothetical protein
VRPEINSGSGETDFFQFLADPVISARYPNLARLAEPGTADAGMGEYFEFGLERVLDGLERHIETHR